MDVSGERLTLTRRTALGTGLIAAAVPWQAQAKSYIHQDAAPLLSTPASAIIATSEGRVQGFQRGDVYVFRGIPYGRDTGGAARFRPPQRAAAWEGVRRALNYGPVCPQPVRDRSNDTVAFVCDWDDGYPGEECLRVNVWSADLDAKARRPVMLWIHGGGFSAGSSQELPAYDGEQLARRGVVVMSVNHRLGPLGYLDLSDLGSELASSGNVGMLDLVLALEWVRDNAGHFGGDPDRVTIFGHSGGGGKVSTLMAMPKAKGLFHRAIVMSGSFPAGIRQDSARASAAALCQELGIAHELAALQAVDAAAMMAASTRLQQRAARGAGGFSVRQPRLGFGPVVDGNVLPQGWESQAPSQSANIPLMIGTVRDEFRTSGHVEEADLVAKVAQRYPSQATALVAAVREGYPHLSSSDVAALIGGLDWRALALEQADKQYALHGAPVYSYWYTWPSPLLDGAVGVPHGSDLPAAFDQVARCEQLTGNAPEAHAIATVMSQAMVAFASTGNPSISSHPWEAYDPQRVSTMVYDRTIQVVSDPLGRARKLLAKS